jgi:hypothetical protein
VGRAIDALLPTSQRALTRELAHRLAKSSRLEIFEVECTRLDGIGCVIEASVSATRFGDSARCRRCCATRRPGDSSMRCSIARVVCSK